MGKVFNPTKASAWDILAAEYGASSKNFMTPTVLDMGKVGNHRAWELSRGRGINNDTIWGVSVVDVDPDTGETTRRTDIGDCFRSRGLAVRLIRSLEEVE